MERNREPELACRAIARLRAERLRLGISQGEVARRSGIERTLISRLEGGRRGGVALRTLERYAAALGLWIELVLVDAGRSAAPAPPAPCPRADPTG